MNNATYRDKVSLINIDYAERKTAEVKTYHDIIDGLNQTINELTKNYYERREKLCQDNDQASAERAKLASDGYSSESKQIQAQNERERRNSVELRQMNAEFKQTSLALRNEIKRMYNELDYRCQVINNERNKELMKLHQEYQASKAEQ